MDINQVLMDYDNMFGTHSLEDIEEFLTTNIEVAMDERDYASALSLLNEMMGLCRDTNQNAKGLKFVNYRQEKLFFWSSRICNEPVKCGKCVSYLWLLYESTEFV